MHSIDEGPRQPVAREQRRMALVLLIVISAAATAAFRFLVISFNNDHFVHLSAAQQVLFGEWPTRDFIDVGRPLQILASAAAQRLLGDTLLAEALLVSAAFGLASSASAAVVWATTESLAASVLAVVAATAAMPRTYAYPKPLALAGGLALIMAYLRRPTRQREALMAAGTAIAFLFRHDLGLFVGLGSLAAVLLREPGGNAWRRARGGLAFVGLVAAMIAPYVAYVQWNGGWWNYAATAFQQVESEAGYVWPNPFTVGPTWEAQLLYFFHAVPLVALAVAVVDWRRGRDGWATRFVICAALVSIAANCGLIRDLLSARLPDAARPVSILAAWLGYRAWRSLPRSASLAVIAVLLSAGVAAADLADVGERADQAGMSAEMLIHPGELARRLTEKSASLLDRRRDPPSRIAAALRPFFEYLDRCTTRQHRLFLGGMIPEVAYLAGRPFGGGGYEHYNFQSPVNQQRVVERLRRQLVPFALIPSASEGDLMDDLPVVAAYLRERYMPLADIAAGGAERVHVLVDRTLSSIRLDTQTGWPCFT